MRHLLLALLLLALASGAAHTRTLELTNRNAELIGKVDTRLARATAKRLMELDAISDDPIFLHVDSLGGSVEAGFILIDTIKAIRSPVHALVESKAYSMAAIITLFCDKRFMLPNATLMFHEASYGTRGEEPSIRSRVEFNTRFLDRMHRKIAEHIDMDGKKYRDLIRDGWWLLAEDALSVGIIDEIVTSLSYTESPTERVEIRRTVTITRKRHIDPDSAD